MPSSFTPITVPTHTRDGQEGLRAGWFHEAHREPRLTEPTVRLPRLAGERVPVVVTATSRQVVLALGLDTNASPAVDVVTAEAADVMNRARAAGGRLWAVGTTVTRTLETVVARNDVADTTSPAAVRPGSGWTSLYIRPGFRFAAVDRLITNFHLPRSTLLMLVSAFAGHERTMHAYREAVARRYRFYSYGDAMAVL